MLLLTMLMLLLLSLLLLLLLHTCYCCYIYAARLAIYDVVYVVVVCGVPDVSVGVCVVDDIAVVRCAWFVVVIGVVVFVCVGIEVDARWCCCF